MTNVHVFPPRHPIAGGLKFNLTLGDDPDTLAALRAIDVLAVQLPTMRDRETGEVQAIVAALTAPIRQRLAATPTRPRAHND